MVELGRAALVVTLGLVAYATVAGRLRRRDGGGGGSPSRRATRSSRRSAPRSSPPSCSRRHSSANDFSLTYVADHSNRSLSGLYKLSAFWGGQEGSLLLWLLILTGLCRPRRLAQPQPHARPRRVGDAGARSDRGRVLVPARRRREPVRRAGGADRRGRAQPEPAEPVHGRPPAVPLPRLRRPRGAVRIRDGRAARRAARTSAGSSRRGAGRSSPGRRSASASCSAPTGPTSRSAGAATTRGTRSRTPL